MSRIAIAIAMSAALTLTACGGNTENTGNNADDFAARINSGGETPAPQGTVAPKIAEPREGAAPGSYAPGTLTDPESSTCSATKMGPFIGRQADDATRQEIVEVVAGANEVRFILPGGTFIRPDATNPRLNIMLDSTNIIRDARCG